MNLLALLLAGLAFPSPPLSAQETPPSAERSVDPELAEQGRRDYLGRQIARTMHWSGAEWLLRESREDEEKSSLLRSELGLVAGATVCDFGCGNGFFTLPMAETVGPLGKVYAVDIQEEMLTMLAERSSAAGLSNVEPVLATVADPRLSVGSCDLIVMVDVYHEISHPVTVLRHLRAALRPGGRIVLVEFRAEDPTVPIKEVHKMSKAQQILELAANGLSLERAFDGLPWQHLMAFGVDPDWSDEQSPEEHALHAGRAVAVGLLGTLRARDALSLPGFFAPEVLVAAGSGGELPPDRLERDELVRSYARAMEREGWPQVVGGEERPHEVRSELGDSPRARKGDLLLALPGADSTEPAWEWLLRANDAGQWRVVAERSPRRE